MFYYLGLIREYYLDIGKKFTAINNCVYHDEYQNKTNY